MQREGYVTNNIHTDYIKYNNLAPGSAWWRWFGAERARIKFHARRSLFVWFAIFFFCFLSLAAKQQKTKNKTECYLYEWNSRCAEEKRLQKQQPQIRTFSLYFFYIAIIGECMHTTDVCVQLFFWCGCKVISTYCVYEWHVQTLAYFINFNDSHCSLPYKGSFCLFISIYFRLFAVPLLERRHRCCLSYKTVMSDNW